MTTDTQPADQGRPMDGPLPARTWLAVAAAFAAFALLLTVRLGEREFWLDEQITVGHISAPEKVFDAFHPPGYYSLLRQWAQLFGQSDLALRAFSVPWGLLALLMVWLLARALLPRTAAVLAVWLCALSPFVLLYLRMARYFAITMAAALCAAYFLLLVRRCGKPLHYVGLAASASAVLWLHHVPALLLAVGYLWALPAAWRHGRERYWWAGAALLPLVAYSPQVHRSLAGAADVASGSGAVEVGLRSILLKAVFAGYSVLIGETTDFWRLYIVLPVAAAGIALCCIGCWAVWRARDEERWMLLMPWPLTVAVVIVLLSTVAASEPWPRVSSLSLFAAPFFYMLVARGAAGVARFWGVGLVTVFVAGQVYGTANYLGRRQFLNPGYNVPWRQVNDLIQSRGGQGDVAIAVLDSTVTRYWSGPVRFHHGLARDPTMGRETEREILHILMAGSSVWVIWRDRGSELAKRATDDLVATLRQTTDHNEMYRIYPRSPGEQHWRTVVQGEPAQDAYLRVYRFWRDKAGR